METLGILDDIQSLISDQLQVVSYKWLSRNYLLSSNAAKRLLQEFVEKHGNGLEVAYALSGWIKSDPPSYHIRLVTGSKLDEAKQEFDGGCSVQVYSVQASIPKDPGVLWNSEFVQAEELFKQPSTVDNCLRDNRLCAITNTFIKRNVDETPSTVSAPKFQVGVGTGPSKCSSTRSNTQAVPQKAEQSSSKVVFPSPKVVKDVKSENNGTGVQDQTDRPPTSKEKVPSVPVSKKKVPNSKSASGTEGSLANFWNRASAKSKASSPAEINSGASVEVPICPPEAKDSEGGNSDDDDGQDMSFKRASNGDSTRKRRVVFDFSDDDEEDKDTVNLSSPERGLSGQDMEESIKLLAPKKNDIKIEKVAEDKPKVEEKVAVEKVLKQSEDSSAGTDDMITETSSKEKQNSSDSKNNVNEKDKLAKSTPDPPKRRKVLKTRIDERGREVTEVIWEGEESEPKKAENDTAEKSEIGAVKKTENTTAATNAIRPPGAKKSPAVGNAAPSNPGGKTGNKKAAQKDPKQGNILSFFKRV